MTTEPVKRGRSRGCMIAIAAVALLLICGVFGALFFPDSDDPAVPAATEQSATAEPPQPTNTAPPSPTEPPPPTEAPRPTATEAPTAPADEQTEVLSYLASLTEISQVYVDALNGLTAQSGAAADDANVILTDEWKLMTAAYLAVIRLSNDQLRALDPPAILEDAHADVLEAAGHYDTMATLYAEGVDELDIQKLGDSAESMNLGTLAIQQATEKIAALGVLP